MARTWREPSNCAVGLELLAQTARAAAASAVCAGKPLPIDEEGPGTSAGAFFEYVSRQSAATCFARADLRFAAWFL